MRQITLLLFCVLLGINSLLGQNLYWTLPSEYLDSDQLQILTLPTPTGSSPEEVYQGAQAEYSHAAYSDANGELLFFSVDNYFYDKNGYGISHLYQGSFGSGELRGYSEKLILPMGDDCKRYAIIFPDKSTIAGGFSSTAAKMSLYMAIYDLDGTNAYNANAVGEIQSTSGSSTLGNNFTDIGKRDGQLYGATLDPLYGYEGATGQANYRSFIQIAATELIDGCFYYVYVFEGEKLVRYKLTENDLEWDNYTYTVPASGSNSCDIRSEMELIKLANGNYRLAIPKCFQSSTNIGILDIDGSTGDVIASSYNEIDLGQDSNNANAYPHGLEFSATGDFLYITHAANLNLPSALDVYDVSANAFLGPLPALTGISNFRDGFIERIGNKMIVAGDDALGELTGIDNPPSGLGFDATWRSISSGYGNGAGETFNTFFRYLLPDQIDMPYPDVVEDMSCACCREYSGDAQKYATTQNESWDQNGNSITGSGTDIHISQELRVRKGTTLELSNLNFYFGKDAKVVVERGDGTLPGGQLVMDNTVFTLDDQCIPETYDPCKTPGECDYLFWKGVRVEGVASEDQPTSGFTNQGKMIMKNNSMIEYAQVGIWTNNDDCSICGGGILTIENSTFKDNVTGIYFDSYVRFAGGNETFNRSVVRANNFTRTGDIPFNSRLTHVRMKNSSTINLRGNIYQNEAWQNYDIDFRGYGVHATNSSVSEKWLCPSNVIPCPNKIRSEYKNLRRGIDASTWSSTRTVSVGFAIFENNEIGVAGGGLVRPEILDSDFYVINSHNATGIYLLGSTGYSVENNFFTAMNTSPVAWMFGIIIHSSGPDANEIYNNTFERITTGIASAGVNAGCNPSFYDIGLRWICNRFGSTIPYADIYVDSGNVSDEQGGCTGGDQPARNIFSHTGLPAMDIRVDTSDLDLCAGSSAFDIKYYHNQLPVPTTPFAARLVPQEYTTNYVFPNACTVLPTSGDCPVRNTSLDAVATPKSDGVSEALTLENFQEMAAQFYATDAELSTAQVVRNESLLWNELIGAYQWDTAGAFPSEEVMAMINEYQPEYAASRFTAALAHSLGVDEPEWVMAEHSFSQEAEQLALSVSDSGELPDDLTEFAEVYDFSNASFVADLNEQYAENNQSFSVHIPLPSDLELPYDFGKQGGGKTAKVSSTVSIVSLQPNPFNETLNLFLSVEEDYESVRVVFHDILGRTIADRNFGDITRVEIDGSAFPSGMVIYSVFIDGELLDTGKIVKAE